MLNNNQGIVQSGLRVNIKQQTSENTKNIKLSRLTIARYNKEVDVHWVPRTTNPAELLYTKEDKDVVHFEEYWDQSI